ncbi:MAG: thiamine pyrophosphate-binding protein [Thermoanaerobaculia bacterium]|nr:thiamine pyrophosphate-binding protein [Thermoanaerobaculia bacterium]
MRTASGHGGDRIAAVLERHGVRFLFTLCGGHISPILTGCKTRGIRVVDVRHEASAVFAADAVARLTGVPGVAAVTAGPGVTNTITAIKNAQLAQSPVVVLGGATGTILKGRGSLQDIDQMALASPHVKWAASTSRVRELAPTLERALWVAREGVPGPVFVEVPVDLLYGEETVRMLYGQMGGGGKGLAGRALAWYLDRHVAGLFRGADGPLPPATPAPAAPAPSRLAVRRAARLAARAERPLLMVGSQAMLEAPRAQELAAAVERLGWPVYLTGMARGLLGKGHPLQRRHHRRRALRAADLVVLAGVPFDFRLDYGRQIHGKAGVVAANRSREELTKNRSPTVAAEGDPALFVRELAARVEGRGRWAAWLQELAGREAEREEAIAEMATRPTEHVNPIHLCREIDRALPDDSVLVADGGDFVATASYTISPRGPLSWLDPGVFGTLGVGGGFALGAALCRPQAEVWLLWGDGSSAYSIAELDTFVRHGLSVVAVVGNDASWAQIAREQVEILGDDVGTVLLRTGYHGVADGYGARGFLLDRPEKIGPVLAAARDAAGAGQPVLVNALLGATDFRKGSISM